MSSWEFLGGENENMWMLSEDGLRKLCGQYKIDADGCKDDLIARRPPRTPLRFPSPLAPPVVLPPAPHGAWQHRCGSTEAAARVGRVGLAGGGPNVENGTGLD